jgi:hypothetical protein
MSHLHNHSSLLQLFLILHSQFVFEQSPTSSRSIGTTNSKRKQIHRFAARLLSFFFCSYRPPFFILFMSAVLLAYPLFKLHSSQALCVAVRLFYHILGEISPSRSGCSALFLSSHFYLFPPPSLKPKYIWSFRYATIQSFSFHICASWLFSSLPHLPIAPLPLRHARHQCMLQSFANFHSSSSSYLCSFSC